MPLDPVAWNSQINKRRSGIVKPITEAARRRNKKRQDKMRGWSLRFGFFKWYLKKIMRRQVDFVLRRSVKELGDFRKEQRMLGCSELEFCQYIESQFHSGMNWSGYQITWCLSPIRGKISDTNINLKVNEWFCRWDNWKPVLFKNPQNNLAYEVLHELRAVYGNRKKTKS